MSQINLHINRLNNFLDHHVFTISDSMGEMIPGVTTDVKVHITGTKTLTRVGTETEFLTYSLIIIGKNDRSNTFVRLFMDGNKEIELSNSDIRFYSLISRVSHELENVLSFFSIENPVICTKVIDETSNNINENLIMESGYNGIVRQIVKDITEAFKMDRTGSFNLPEDLRESELYYDYPQFKKEFEVSVNFEQSDDVETFEVDGDLYYDDDNIEILVITNPNSGNEIINDLIRELNEVVRHELEHIKQYDKGMRRKKEPQDPEKYYSQNHEIDAQRAGFKRRSKQEKTGMESLVRDWFKKYPHKHNLTPEQQERVIQKILSEK